MFGHLCHNGILMVSLTEHQLFAGQSLPQALDQLFTKILFALVHISYQK